MNLNLIESMLKNSDFYPVYQPIVRLADSSVHSFEILTRWNTDQMSCSVEKLFSAIDSKLGRDISLLVFSKALDSFQHSPTALNVNFSSLHLLCNDTISRITQLINYFNYPSHLITIEVTEVHSTFVMEQLATVLCSLNSFGIRTSLDDFGAQASSYDRLFSIPFNQVKIDRFFIKNIEVDSLKQELLRHFVSFIPKFDCEIVAEGVESTLESQYLMELGIDLAQGYLFAKPQPFHLLKSEPWKTRLLHDSLSVL
ncbi:EAL domain-containing protein [Vibrio sp. 1180_3]|uniref:EAL domain-containing protein n=1 Tax=Vibrio sp. 1180_3 TaxID=2528832 RepID=UPI0024073B32|nr:EAL domain-containing protein [Vibrio sp. 1180_3]MDF9399157.1 EAL domain-containing protein [Vibrio sp. 1180_3]